ncbi:Putative uncharacterized protein [Taphrina deformans PYCC 5710]|uniref:Non-homologous end-joining factor 1 n=1 Tax=Taphrina deformans (strain PYCC 5710 / ATCC 11124 / CBS 356.35 / IMI 108563 / JCM 9778 / NBRC 8474) TaxID=1097556 RepID=R4XBD9_TAPDE|nr:Putative uncharacterized protein [Taphrina deformans PYCC 5710]|eukprot:CCG82915.1 Putative uncharacterized protein [Taphrina deformans PYCC 5710]
MNEAELMYVCEAGNWFDAIPTPEVDKRGHRLNRRNQVNSSRAQKGMQVLAVPWIQLPGQQNILIQALFTEVDYCIRVTDLQTIWGEDLSKKEVQERADSLDCPIHAYINLKELLKHLQDCLTVDSSVVEIVLKRRKDVLHLSTTEQIGSTALDWEFELSALPYSAVASGLTLALFSMMAFYQREIKSLLEVIQDKDNVIHQMSEFLRTANLTFKPNRRQKAYNKFDKSEWLTKCRGKAERDTKSSQDVIDELSLVGREADFRKDWRAVLTEISQWEVKFLPQTTERTPTRVTASLRRESNPSKLQDPLHYTPTLARDDTKHQSNEFISPTRSRTMQKTKM